MATPTMHPTLLLLLLEETGTQKLNQLFLPPT